MRIYRAALPVSHTMPKPLGFTRNFNRGVLGSIPGEAGQGWALGCWLWCLHVLWLLRLCRLLLGLFNQRWHGKLEVGQVESERQTGFEWSGIFGRDTGDGGGQH